MMQLALYMDRIQRRWRWLAIAALAIASPLAAANYYVATNGTHQSPFASWATAATNIQDAVDAAVNGSAIIINTGEFKTTLDLSGRSLSFVGMGSENTVLRRRVVSVDPDPPIPIATLRDGSVVEFNSLAMKSFYEDLGPGVVSFDSTVRIERCSFWQCVNEYGGALFVSNSLCTVNKSVFERNYGVNYGGAGMFFDSTGRIENTRAFGNLAGKTGAAGGFWITNSSITFFHTVFFANVGNAVDATDRSANLLNCIVWSNTVNIPAKFSCIQNGSVQDGNITNDPLLTRASFHLLWNSPCLDRGTNILTTFTDIDDEPRPQGSQRDIGADEWLSSTGDRVPDWWKALWGYDFGSSNIWQIDTNNDGVQNINHYALETSPVTTTTFRIIGAINSTIRATRTLTNFLEIILGSNALVSFTCVTNNAPGSYFVADGTNGTFIWTPTPDQVGSWSNVNFIAEDTGSIVSNRTIITVIQTNRAPELGSIGNKTIGEGQLLSFYVVALDPDYEPLQFVCSNQSMPGSTFTPVSITTGLFEWLPSYAAAGVYSNVFFGVSDGEYADHEYIAITVTNRFNPPSSPGVTINHGDQFTNSTSVALSLTASNAAEMAIGLDESATTNWMPYATATNWLLAQVNATNTVFARFRTAWFDETTNVAAWIIVETNLPVCTSLFPGNGYVAPIDVTLAWSATDDANGSGIASYRLETNGIAFSIATTNFTFVVAAAQTGLWRVMAFDPAGNASSWTDLRWFIRAPVLLPIGNKTIGEGQLLSFYIVALDPDPGAPQFVCSNQSMPGSTFTHFSGTTGLFEWLPSYTAAGIYSNVFFGVSDGAYAVHKYIAITVTNCFNPPTSPGLTINNGATFTNCSSVVLSLSASNAAEMAIGLDQSATTNWMPYATATNWLLAQVNATNTVFARYRTPWLDTTTNVADWIIFETNPPVCTALFPNNGYVSLIDVALVWSATDGSNGSGIASYCLETNGIAFPLATTSFTFVIATGQTGFWRVMAFDHAGNASSWTPVRWFILPEPGGIALFLALLAIARIRRL